MYKPVPIDKIEKLISYFEQKNVEKKVTFFLKAFKDVQSQTLLFLKENENGEMDVETVKNATAQLNAFDLDNFYKYFFLEKDYCDFGHIHESGLPFNIILSHLEKANEPELQLSEQEKDLLNAFQNYAIASYQLTRTKEEINPSTGEVSSFKEFHLHFPKTYLENLLKNMQEGKREKVLFSHVLAFHLATLLSNTVDITGANNQSVRSLILNYTTMAIKNEVSFLNTGNLSSIVIYQENGKPIKTLEIGKHPHFKNAELLLNFFVMSLPSINSKSFESVY